jgi:hypothetical protein
MNLFLDIDGTLIETQLFPRRTVVLKENVNYIKGIVGDEIIDSITLLSFGLVGDAPFKYFMKEFGFIFTHFFNTDIKKVIYVDTLYLKGATKREMFLHASPDFGHSMFFDDTLKKEYEAVKCSRFEKELFKV